jgi:hypothetical protein
MFIKGVDWMILRKFTPMMKKHLLFSYIPACIGRCSVQNFSGAFLPKILCFTKFKKLLY